MKRNNTNNFMSLFLCLCILCFNTTHNTIKLVIIIPLNATSYYNIISQAKPTADIATAIARNFITRGLNENLWY